jgi:hypothetical protein
LLESSFFVVTAGAAVGVEEKEEKKEEGGKEKWWSWRMDLLVALYRDHSKRRLERQTVPMSSGQKTKLCETTFNLFGQCILSFQPPPPVEPIFENEVVLGYFVMFVCFFFLMLSVWVVCHLVLFGHRKVSSVIQSLPTTLECLPLVEKEKKRKWQKPRRCVNSTRSLLLARLLWVRTGLDHLPSLLFFPCFS